MIQIAICDDSEVTLQHLNQSVSAILKSNQEAAAITLYSSSESLSYDIEEGHFFDLILTDIEMPHMNGMELAATIRTYLPGALIIFITAYTKYALEVFEQSAVVDDILLMTDKDHVEYCKKEICEKYGIKKVSAVAPGGKERYESVWKALCILKERGQSGFVMIHDGARPFITDEILKRVYEQVQVQKACVVGMPVKDTIKLINKEKQIKESPDRSLVW